MSIVCISLVRNLNALRSLWLEEKFLLRDGGVGVDLCCVCYLYVLSVVLYAFVLGCRILD